MEGEAVVGASWTLGLSFILLTVAFHTTCGGDDGVRRKADSGQG